MPITTSCEFEPYLWRGVLDTTLCDKVCQWLATGQWFSLISSTTNTDRHDMTEIFLKVVLTTINQPNSVPTVTVENKSDCTLVSSSSFSPFSYLPSVSLYFQWWPPSNWKNKNKICYFLSCLYDFFSLLNSFITCTCMLISTNYYNKIIICISAVSLVFQSYVCI